MKDHLFDKPKNVQRLLKGLFISLTILIVLDFFIPKHPYFPWEKYFSFYAAYGFIACVGLVLAAKHILRKIVKRREDYYDD